MQVVRPLLVAAAFVLAAAPAAHGDLPDDPGLTTNPGGWQRTQWNLIGPFGVNAPGGWANLRGAGRPGGRGVVVAVLDTGVAYRAAGAQPRSPDLAASSFVRGYDVVDDDPYPVDRNGHGTHVASTIAEATDNGSGFTGLAFGARIMPVRVLRDDGNGTAADVARGVRWATRHGADVINLSVAFEGPAARYAGLLSAVRQARRKGIVVVAAAGNDGSRRVSIPARSHAAIAVGGTTAHGCLWAFSSHGPGLDLVAPGGGSDAVLPGDARCDPDDDTLPDITQITVRDGRFGPSRGYQGSSMAAAHVSAAAALVIASRTLGRHPSPAAVERRLERSARDLGAPGLDSRYGHGLLDAAAATAP